VNKSRSKTTSEPILKGKIMNLRKLAATVALLSMAGAAAAADQADVRVSASVINNCKILATQDINFGQLDPAVADDKKASGEIRFACTRNVDYLLTANEGANFDKATSSRRMKGGADTFLPYGIEQATFNGRGEGFSNPLKVTLAASLAGANYKDLPADNYVDVIRVTLTP
jgi:spore coat protein U-like protein